MRTCRLVALFRSLGCGWLRCIEQRGGLRVLGRGVGPGRSIVARGGVARDESVASKPLLGDGSWGLGVGVPPYQLPYPNSHPPSRYLHVDGGMADNIRPALYGARYTA